MTRRKRQFEVTEDAPHEKKARKEVDLGLRRVIISDRALHGLSYRDIEKLHNIPPSTSKGIYNKAIGKATAAGEADPGLACVHDQENVYIGNESRLGRPEALTSREKSRLIRHALKDRVQRAKTWTTIARELGWGHLAPTTINKYFHQAGYRRYSTRYKPGLSRAQRRIRRKFAKKLLK